MYADRSVEALQGVLQTYEGEGNGYGVVAACRELGRSYRNASQFSEAVDVHKKGLAAAQEIGDTTSSNVTLLMLPRTLCQGQREGSTFCCASVVVAVEDFA